MITVRLIGGLGNQMFQYAIGRRLSLEREVPLAVDLGWFGHQARGDTPRSYELGCFAADASAQKVSLRLPEPSNKAEQVLGKLRALMRPVPDPWRQRGMSFDPSVLAVGSSAHLVGFWQSERFFDSVAPRIRRDFRPIQPPSEEARSLHDSIAVSRSISVHVRRGDYVTNAAANRFHGTPDRAYYRRALEAIGVEGAHLFVFSDDPRWCLANLDLGGPMTVIGGHDRPAAEDMLLMSACEHHVIANSSFSWWGAWLDPSPKKKVVAPARWTADADTNSQDVYAAGWLRV